MFYRRTINLKNKSGLRAAVALILTAAMLLLCACNDAETPEKAIKRFNKRMNDCDYKAAFNYVKDYDGLSFDSGDKNVVIAPDGQLYQRDPDPAGCPADVHRLHGDQRVRRRVRRRQRY